MKIIKSVLLSSLLVFGLVNSAFAKPPVAGGSSELGKQLFKFNILAKTTQWTADDSACPNNGNRIFVAAGETNTIAWTLNPSANGFNITDCNATVDNDANIVADEKVDFAVVARVLGPKTSSLTFVCQELVNDTATPGEALCVLDSGTISRGTTFTKLMKNVYDNELEEVLWTLNGDYKIIDVRVYEYFK